MSCPKCKGRKSVKFRAIVKIVNVSHKTVYDWVKAFGELTYEKVKPEGDIIIELDTVKEIQIDSTSIKVHQHGTGSKKWGICR